MAEACCESRAPLQTGDLAAIIIINTGSPDPVSGIEIWVECCEDGYRDDYVDWYSNCGEDGAYPNATANITEYTTAELPPNSTLTIDATTHTVTLTETDTGQQIAGIDSLDFLNLFLFPEASRGACLKICASADNGITNPDTTISVTTWARDY